MLILCLRVELQSENKTAQRVKRVPNKKKKKHLFWYLGSHESNVRKNVGKAFKIFYRWQNIIIMIFFPKMEWIF